MGRAFQTAIYLHKPEIIFVLGNLLNFSYFLNMEIILKNDLGQM